MTPLPPPTFIQRKGQRNLRIRVKADQIIVSGPARCSKRELERFLNERMDWVHKHFRAFSARQQQIEAALGQTPGRVMLRGQAVPVQVRHPIPGAARWKLTERSGGIDAYPPENGSGGIPDAVLTEFLKETARKEIPERFHTLAATLPFSYRSVFIRSQKTKWGTCSSKGNLSFNWRLIKCPFRIWEYIFIHELCHTVHFNHSKSYWELVHAHFPETKAANAWIREHGFLVFSDRYGIGSGSENNVLTDL